MGFLGLFGGGSKKAKKYLNQMDALAREQFEPYAQQGREAYAQLGPQYQQLITNPGQRMNEIGQDFHQSPGYQFAMQQALQAANNAAAAGGMAGSPMHQQQNMELASNLANQDYYNYLDRAGGYYGIGLNGLGGTNQMGYDAMNNLNSRLSQSLAQRAAMAYQSGLNNSNLLQSLFSGGLKIAGFSEPEVSK